MYLTHSLYELMRSPLGCIFASYIFMSKKFNYPFLANCRDLVERLKSNTDAKSCKVVESASYIIDEMKGEETCHLSSYPPCISVVQYPAVFQVG